MGPPSESVVTMAKSDGAQHSQGHAQNSSRCVKIIYQDPRRKEALSIYGQSLS